MIGRSHASLTCITIVVMVAAGAGGCDRKGREYAQASIEAQPGEFSSYYRRIDTLRLEVPDATPLIRVSGLAIGPRGQILIGDVSESNVKWFDRTGRLLRVLGRRGDGPGEFAQPRFPRFSADGRVFVADAMMSRIAVFDSLGRVLKTVSLEGFSPIMGFAVLPDGRFVLTGSASAEDVVFIADSTGRIIQHLLRADRTLPRAGPESPFWRPVTQHWLALVGDTAIVASTLSDSLWRVSLLTGQIAASRLVVPGYIEPVVLHEVSRDFRAMTEWTKSFHIAATVLASSSQVAVPFVRGVLNYGDPMILAVRSGDGPWRALSGAPPVIAVNGDSLVTLEHPGEVAVTLGFYVPVRR